MDTKVNAKKRKSVEKPLCKYGLSCYQKNPEHHKKFKHPSGKETIVKYLNKNSLSDAPKGNTSEVTVIDTPETNIPEQSVVNAPVNTAKESILGLLVKTDTDAIRIEETVDEILKSMPKDFFDFWKFCCSINKSNPQDAFSNVGYKLVGVFDLLAKKLPEDMKVDISCHWRYFYDPPELQTVIKKDGEDLHHIGYFRDDPTEKPSILASNRAAVDSKLTLMGDNIFCAMNVELTKIVKSSKSKDSKSKATKLQEKLLEFASLKKYATSVRTSKTNQRQKNVVAKTIHGLGIVVPVKNDVGYRPLSYTDAAIMSILKMIATAPNEAKRLDHEEQLDEIVSNVHFANDECDYGMGFELGIDLFCSGDPYFHKHISQILPLAYNLLKRPKFGLIVKAHLRNRKKGDKLSTL